MQQTEQVHTSKLTRPPDLVKAKITALGVSMRLLAGACGISKPRLSDAVNGRTRRLDQQTLICERLRELTGVRAVNMDWLWGELHAGRNAA